MSHSFEQGRPVTTPWAMGAALSEARCRKGLTPAQAAELAGVSRAWLNRAEGGADRIELGRLLDTLRALDVELVMELAPSEDRENSK